jgi:uncharacterized protein (TIGR00369 family)
MSADPSLGALQASLKQRWHQEPMVCFLGLQLSWQRQALHVTMPFADSLVGNPMLPALHGGTVAALLQFSATFELLWQRPEVAILRTVDLHVDYLRSGRASDTFAEAHVRRMGRRVALVQAEAWQGERGQPIAVARAHVVMAEVRP